MSRPTPLHPPTKLLPTLALVLAAVAALLLRPAPSSANSATSACSSSTHDKHHVRACAGRHRAGHARAKAKGRHSGHRRHRINKKKKASQHGSAHSPAAVAKPASCEDGSRPQSESDGSFSCADGSEPVCASGGEPTPTKNGAKLVCPVAPAAGVEWSEAECEDGSAPERSAGAAYACDDGSRPACSDGSSPTLSDDGSMLVCLIRGTPAPSSPAPSPPVEEAGEDESEGQGGFR